MHRNHIIIIDGTQSRMTTGEETNAGILYKLLLEVHDPKTTSLHYDAGVQGHGLWNLVTLASGMGINKSIKNAYDLLASKYRAGDRIFLFGYSRGAYAVRSLAGMIDQVGLLRRECATHRNLRQAFRLYEQQASAATLRDFCAEHCAANVEITMVGVWDTVKALGLPYPLISRLAPMATEFHNDRIGACVKHGYQALAIDENRIAYTPELWDADPSWPGQMQQVWFKGGHADVGGQVYARPAARGLSNIPLTWILKKVVDCGLTLPDDWRQRYPCDETAPKVGSYRGIAKFFLFRKRRVLGCKSAEFIHPSAKSRFKGDAVPIPLLSQEN
ncbi:hypothetical protein GCM10007939_01580 [Amylibacter marinus]|uniref:T6SS Phospholipase effector Tle1-like catalytic domain-containing protein n=1 Tax=Amylibacter marinus TaxID=1475483 RepID=A0ABQ5VR35_9RHOB|nr:DUF2235 domain-containing protein [Amylibacter marinus]GLQ33875.1 hypothetical protein GCM10007939_01580 [Amylibacter marinus]